MVLVRSELLGQFVNTLNADYKYYRWNYYNLSQQVPMQTSQKLKTCARFLIAFLRSLSKLEYFQKKGKSQILSITEIITAKQVAT